MRASRKEYWDTYRGVLTNAIAVTKNMIACIDTTTGLLTIGAASATRIPIGYFDVAAGQTTTGDGTLKVSVALFDAFWIHFFDNDTTTPVVASDVGSPGYMVNGETITSDSAGGGLAGTIWAVNATNGVGVRFTNF